MLTMRRSRATTCSFSVQQQLTGCRSFDSRLGFNAYTKAGALWGATRKEVGFYRIPFGLRQTFLDSSGRAAGVDTGNHPSWTRDQVWSFPQSGAVDEPTSNPKRPYIAWPAQASSYKLGR